MAVVIPISDPSVPRVSSVGAADLFWLDQFDNTQITGYKTKAVSAANLFSSLPLTAGFTGGTVGPTVVGALPVNGVWISGANSPGISYSSIVQVATEYAQQLIQFTTAQISTIGEVGLSINFISDHGYTSTPGFQPGKVGAFIQSNIKQGSGAVWNIASDMIITSTYGASPNNTNNFAANVEFDITNNGWDASPGNSVGNIVNVFVNGQVGSFPITAEVWVTSQGGDASHFASHYGYYAAGAFTIKDATFYDATNSSIAFYDTGSHIYGLNLSGTYSTAQISATGFFVLPAGQVMTAVYYGGAATNSTATLQSTNNGSPSGDKVIIAATGITLGNIAATIRALDWNVTNAGYVTIGGVGSVNGLAMTGKLIVQTGNVSGNTSTSYSCLNSAASSTQPTLVPNQSDLKAGIGADAAGDVSIIADISGTATEMFRVASALTCFGELITAASTTARAGLKIPSGTAPTSPADGEFWYDGTNVKFHVGATTKTFTLT